MFPPMATVNGTTGVVKTVIFSVVLSESELITRTILLVLWSATY